MSDDDRDIDIESDEGEDSDSRSQSAASGRQSNSYHGSSQRLIVQAEKRAHHNALERKRRDHIKDSFSSLRDSVPSLNGEKVVRDGGSVVNSGSSSSRVNTASRAQILKKAADYIQFMRRKNNSHQQDIEDLKRQNSLLESQIRTLEKAKAAGTFGVETTETKEANYNKNESESDTSDTEATVQTRRPKKLKVAGYH